MKFIADPHHPSNWNRDERNIYARVFGFLFAKPAPDPRHDILFRCENRIGDDPAPVEGLELLTHIPRPAGELVVSFDNNLHDVVPEAPENPEYGDIVIWGTEEFITIEAKGHTGWNFDNDVGRPGRSAKQVAQRSGYRHLGHVLLVTEQKLEAVQAPSAVSQSNSQWDWLIHWIPDLQDELLVVTWQQIADEVRTLEGREAGEFAAWLTMQQEICLLNDHEMPPR